ncbi:MAG: pitrilysin family protein [Verrucomicrobia bacterium]|nr:pitrilysin family protein [Verrucomicrobiota bacterium]
MIFALSMALSAATFVHAADAPVNPLLSVLKESNRKLRREVLDNGAICLVKEDHSAAVVAVQIWIGTGAIHEEENLGGGLSHYVEHMIFKGTEIRGATRITKDIDEAGGKINAYTSTDRTVIYCTVPSRNWQVGVDVLTDAVMNSVFPEEEWEREKEVILREFAMGRDQPDRVLYKLLNATAYNVHPYRVPVIGYEDVFQSMAREQLVAFYREHYVPDNMMVVVVGDVDADEVLSVVRKNFSEFKRRPRAPVILPEEPPQLGRRFARATGAYKVSRLRWAVHTVELSDPDTPALDVLASIVGSGRSSRLNSELKEKRQLVHGVGAYSMTPMDPGLFVINASFDPEKEGEVIAAIEEQVRSWSEGLFTEQEIAKARRKVVSGELSELQTAAGQASSYGSGQYSAGDPRFGEIYVKLTSVVTPEELNRVARKYLDPSRSTLVLLTPEGAQDGAEAAVAAPTPPPEIRRLALSNGLPLIVREDNRLPFVYFCIVYGGGLLSEDDSNSGVSQLMSELLTRGTDKRTALEIAEESESLGASLSAFSGRNSFGLRGRCLVQDVETFMELFTDCALAPTFPDDEFTKEKALQLVAIERQYEAPFFVAREALDKMLFPGHPYRWSTLGTRDSVERITRDAVQAHHARLARSGNAALAIFGNITPERAMALAEPVFSRMTGGVVAKVAREAVKPDLPARAETPQPREQVIYLAGYPGVSVDDPRHEVLQLLGRALSGLSSDLALELRERRGLVYYAGASNVPGLDPGSFFFYAGTRSDAVAEVDRLIQEQAARLASDGIRQDELDRARNQLISARQESLQDNLGLAMATALDELYGLGYEHGFKLEERLNAITIDDVKKVAAEILKPELLATSIVLPELPPEAPLEKR